MSTAADGGARAQPAASKGTIFFTDWRRGEIWRMRPDGGGRRRVTRYPFDGGSGDSSVSVADRGDRLVFVRPLGDDGHTEVFRARRDGSRVRRLTRSRRNAIGYEASISSDGRQVAYIGKGRALWIMGADGSRARKLVDYAGHDEAEMPSFSPDGTTIVFTHTILTPTGPAENEELVVVRSDGTGRQVIGPRYVEVTAPRFSPDGRRIVYGCGDNTDHALCLIDPDGQNLTPLLSKTGRGIGGVGGRSGTTAAFSPAGDQLAFDCRRNHVCVVQSDGTGLRVIGRGSMPDWG